MIQVAPGLYIDEQELEFQFIRSSGPGGQKVNKASTAVQLRFDAAASPGLSDEVRLRLRELAGRRMTAEGVLVIEASRHRSQRRNREEALLRLLALLREASHKRRHRRPTSPGPGQRERRLRGKRERSRLKRSRRRPSPQEE
jgi:ribosome-associated protein